MNIQANRTCKAQRDLLHQPRTIIQTRKRARERETDRRTDRDRDRYRERQRTQLIHAHAHMQKLYTNRSR